ncbi:type VI secretion system membrane subunit TssM [Phyllobacterium sp. 0TCS1.6C]|uniref:type VI secretion system membrane subunit TssM n=1 Tax=unclassified Phyllobacterium TaxID=2638441 RepID=UPI002264702A|nr:MULTISPECIES: type VI secretion system membrane subunit TssM [unclassified Phyllobacterium]MCX8280055.1 type VI secretion system membrane subunit TssM [Phyllobacterium sp. 0TCS1.6C]MCX8294383.1 type VI secretion system membrane subunit TssM [Phyllobacterium sp. 0TCS1.6A]
MNPLSYFYTLRSYVDSYAGIVGRRFVSVIWVAAICVVIWFYGYLIGYGEFKPLESSRNRIITIAIVLVAWAAYMVVSTIRARRRDKVLVDSLEKDAEAEAAASQTAEVSEICNRLKEALALLRRVTKKRFGYVYELPWFVIFGAPGSGKTTALTNSGLKFPLGDALGSNSVQGIGGTRNCNWWFTDEAILIDTAGRYTTQDDLNGAAKAGWEGFLKLLKKYRRSQPINGVLVTLSIGDMLTRDSAARLEEVRAIRQRLSELDEFLQARVPVYLVLTKADLLTGFVEFFDGFSKTDREQVWGTTFDLDESYKAEDLPERYLEEFALLQERVGAMLIERLQQEPSSHLRGRIFRFPAELAALKERLHEVLAELCAGSTLVESPLVRGVYFVSGTQTEAQAPAGQQAGAPRLRRSYFLSRLFKQVIFEEASLVARDKRLSRRQILLRRTAYGLATLLLAIVLTSWTATYFQNTSALARADERIAAYEQLVRGIPIRDVSDADFLRILPALDNLRDVVTGFSENRVWPISFGLDQEGKIASRQREAYQRAANSLLLPRLLVQLEKTINDNRDSGRTFDALKLYGMLGGLGPIDPEFVSLQAEDMFMSLYPGEGRAAVRRALVSHVDSMVSGPLTAVDLDAPLIAKAREIARDQSIAARAYHILSNEREARALAPWIPADALGPLGEQAFERSSKASLRAGIPGLFTGEGYRTVVLPHVMDAARKALDEQWVRGDQPVAGSMTIDAVAQAALQLYFNNFEQQWSGMLTDMRVRSSQTLADATETVRVLANDPGPIEAVARAIVGATDLRPQGSAEIAAADSVPRGAMTLALAGAVNAPDPFGRLREALDAPKSAESQSGEKPLSQLGALQPILKTIYGQLSRASTSTAEVSKVFDVDSQLTESNQALLEETRRLPAPVDSWMAGMTADIGSLAVKTARLRLGNLWAVDGERLCTSIVVGRYPFDRSSARDVTMADFIRLFGPSGLFHSFFKDRLEAFIDTSTTPWRWRGTFGTEGIPSQAIAQFENADKIRRAFFPAGSESPAISINVKPVSLSESAGAVIMEIGGERVLYNHGWVLSKSIAWPSKEASNVSFIAFQPGGLQQALTENGDWSPFRLFDKADISSRGDDLFRARFANGGNEAEFDVQFGSVLNPFRLKAISDFACPAQF